MLIQIKFRTSAESDCQLHYLCDFRIELIDIGVLAT